MYNDPIIGELRAIRRERFRKFGGDPQAIFEDLKRQEAESDREFVQRDVQRISKPESDVEAA